MISKFKFCLPIFIYFIFTFTTSVSAIAFPADPDESMDFSELVSSRGFRLQEHKVTTSDGYILTVHRVVLQEFDDDHVDPQEYSKIRKPVVLFHGILCQSPVFFYNSPFVGPQDNSSKCGDNFGFGLMKTGKYDLWVPNARGNGLSNGHVKLDPVKDAEYWQFSFEQIALYDIPAFIDYIRNETGHRTLGYVGYSQGAGSLFALLSLRPEYGQIIRPFISWAPGVYFERARTMLRPALYSTYQFMHSHPFEFTLTEHWFNSFSQQFCHNPLGVAVCGQFLNSVFGPSLSLNQTRLPVYTHFSPSPCSRWQVAHFVQIGRSGKFTRFDHHERNLAVYGRTTPPEFPLGHIPRNIPTLIMYGQSDWFVDQADARKLVLQLARDHKWSKLFEYQVPNPVWNHFDFLTGQNAGKLVYDKTLEFLDLYVEPNQ